MKKLGLFIMMVWIGLTSYMIPVHANDTGTLSIELQDSIDELSKENVEFDIIQVAKLVDGYYVLNEAFENIDTDLNTELKAEQIEDLCLQLQEIKTEDTSYKTDADGKIEIQDVEEGMYFIRVKNLAEYEPIQPMLVSVPQWEEDTLNYDVHVYPKHSPFQKIILHKIDADTKKDILENVEFTSFKDASCKEKIKTYKGNGTITILMKDQSIYIQETKSPDGYVLSSKIIHLEVKDNHLYVDGKEVESGYILDFENKKIHVPTGLKLGENKYVTLGLIALVIALHIVNKILRKKK